MIDTINIKMLYPQFKIINPELFNPDFKIFSDVPPELKRSPHKVFRKYMQNASADDKSEGIYKPSLTIYRYYVEGKLEYHLHIQFSAPKLLNSNNVQEISAGELDAVIDTLAHKLRTMGIDVSHSVLRQAEVTKVHFGKNIEIKLPLTVIDVISELKKADMGKWMELNERDYKNGGESLYLYNGSRNHIFYDKVKELSKPKNRSYDKDKTTLEKRLGEELEVTKKQILRFEVRFTNAKLLKNTVNQILHTHHDNIKLETVFDELLWKDCLLAEWHSIINRPANQLAFKTSVTPEDALNLLISRQVGKDSNVHALNKILISFGLYQIINCLGIKILKDKIMHYLDEKTCGNRLDEKIRNAVAELKDIPLSEQVSVIEKALQEFERYQT